jgi:hypothetical protein
MSIISPLENLKPHLATVYFIVSYLDHPLEYRFFAPIPAELYALNRHGLELRRRRFDGRSVSQKVVINNPYENLPLVKQVHRLAVQHRALLTGFQIATELLAEEPLLLKRALESSDHALRIRRGRGQRQYENTTYLTKRCGKRQPPRNGRMYADTSKIVPGCPCISFDFIVNRRFIRQHGWTSIKDVVSNGNFRSILDQHISIRDSRGRLHPLPAEMLSATITFTHPSPTVRATANHTHHAQTRISRALRRLNHRLANPRHPPTIFDRVSNLRNQPTRPSIVRHRRPVRPPSPPSIQQPRREPILLRRR